MYSVNIQIVNYRSVHRNVSEFQTPEHSRPSEAGTTSRGHNRPCIQTHGDTSLPSRRLSSGIHVIVSVRWHHIRLIAESCGSNVRRFRHGALGPPPEEDCQPEKIVLNSVAENCERRVQSVQFPDPITILRSCNKAKYVQ